MHRIFITIGNFPIYTYGVIMVLAFIIALAWAIKYTRPQELEPDKIMDYSIYLLIGGIIGARLIYVLLNLYYYLQNPWIILNIRRGGLSWYGAFLGGIVGTLLFAKKEKIKFTRLADIASPSVLLGLAVGRWGCFFNGCCYGKITTLPLGVEFKDAGLEGLRHPTQIYESILCLIGFYILMKIYKHKHFTGEVFLGLLVTYSIVRFIVEFFREWTGDIPASLFGLNLAQWVSLLILIIASIVWIKLAHLEKSK